MMRQLIMIMAYALAAVTATFLALGAVEKYRMVARARQYMRRRRHRGQYRARGRSTMQLVDAERAARRSYQPVRADMRAGLNPA